MFRVLLCGATALWLIGCATVPPFSPIDLNDADWQVQRGNAVWQPSRNKPEIMGELLIATNSAGSSLVQFSKTPFNIVTARRRTNEWEVTFGPEGKRYSGRGAGPGRIVWLRVPELLAGQGPGTGWTVVERSEDGVSIANRRTGEALQIALE